jgi:hypothetical protein
VNVFQGVFVKGPPALATPPVQPGPQAAARPENGH